MIAGGLSVPLCLFEVVACRVFSLGFQLVDCVVFGSFDRIAFATADIISAGKLAKPDKPIPRKRVFGNTPAIDFDIIYCHTVFV